MRAREILRDSFGTTDHLYHGTDLEAILGIVKMGKITPDWEGRDHAGPKGVCLSRSIRVAASHASSRMEHIDEVTFHYFGLGDMPESIRGGVIIEFNRNLIKNQIIAYDDFGYGEGGDGDEEEERVIGDLDMSACSAIYFDKPSMESFVEAMEIIQHKHPDEGAYYGEYISIARTLLKNPIVKPLY